jgi:hypothetical protein
MVMHDVAFLSAAEHEPPSWKRPLRMPKVILRQRLLFALCALAALLVGGEFWMTVAVAGNTGTTLAPTSTPFIEKIASVDPASPGAAAGSCRA